MQITIPMQTILLLNITVVFIAFLARFKKSGLALELAFLIIFLFTGLRYNFGADYPGYKVTFDTISAYTSLFSIDKSQFVAETGWLILCYIFKPIGFFGMVLVLSAFICYTYYSLIKKYVEPGYYWMGVAVYCFMTEIMLIQFSALRQAVAIAIFLFASRYLLEKRSPIKYVLCILLAGTIHSSAYFMLIFVMFAFYKDWNNNKTGYVILTVFFGLLVFGQTILGVMPFLTTIFAGDRYLDVFTADNESGMTLTGGAVWGIMIVIVVYFSKFQPKEFKYFYLFYSMYFISYILINLIWTGDRFGYYFAPFGIIALPKMISEIKLPIIKVAIFLLFFGFILSRFFNFFTYEFVIEGYAKYQTIFSQL